MHRFLMIAVLLGSLAAAALPRQSEAAAGASDAVAGANRAAAAPAPKTGRVVKVLPLFLDPKGHDAISPSLFDRDAYQAFLRQPTNKISAIRFDVLWKASNLKGAKLKLRAELRGIGEHGLPRQSVLEAEVTPAFFRSWTSLTLGGDELKNIGSLVAWRVTLWNGDQLLGEQKSFLW
jgi:hypothetical protein